MSDNCYLEITFRKKDQDALGRHLLGESGEFWDDVHDEDDSWIKVGIWEANYSLFDQRMKAAKAGIPFYGYHAEGGNYGSMLFAAVDGEMFEIFEANRFPCVRMGPRGKPMRGDVDQAVQYMEAERKCRKLVRGRNGNRRRQPQV